MTGSTLTVCLAFPQAVAGERFGQERAGCHSVSVPFTIAQGVCPLHAFLSLPREVLLSHPGPACLHCRCCVARGMKYVF